LENLALPVKASNAGYLLVIGLGLLIPVTTMLTHAWRTAIGLSMDDLVYSYFGDREVRSWKLLNG
jgi:hypothetical protein